VKVEITLDPQPIPKVQYLELTSIPEPDARIQTAAEMLVTSANGTDAELPPLADIVDRASLDRDLVLVRTLFGQGRLGAPVAGDYSSATFGVVAQRGTLDLAVSIDAMGRLLSARWTPRPVTPPRFDVP
jgi:hypothetical protein